MYSYKIMVYMHSLVLKQSLYFNNLMSEIVYNLLFMFQQIDLAISHYDTHIFLWEHSF